MSFRTQIFGAVAALALVAGSAEAANVTTRVTIFDAINPGGLIIGTVTDGGPGDLSPLPGQVAAGFNYANIAFTFQSATGTPATPVPGFSGNVTISSEPIGGGGAASLPVSVLVEFSQNGIPIAAGQIIGNAFGATNLLGNNTNVTTTSYVDGSNALFGTGTMMASNVFNPAPNAQAFNQQANIAGTPSPYSQTVSIAATIVNQGTTIEANFQLIGVQVPVPAPAALAVFGLGLLGLGLVARRRA